ncbi:M23 family metallopeptidase [Microbacterium sp. YY-01]|uniref:M23 family metallopeptidase n=1 Tax=Microbacterium sp. YY-01 TaxID=3421634 RepID=UPI003D17F9B2
MSQAINMSFPFEGDWLVQHSPANRVPSHGTELFASSYAIDFVPVSRRRTAPFTIRSMFRSESPELFPGFGRPILAPVEGIVVAAHDCEPDHDAYRGLPSIRYALTQRRRVAAGWSALAGNHIFIAHEGAVVALCHLHQGSATVRPGQRVQRGDVVGHCGNSGNSTEPHVHVQAFRGDDVRGANAVPLLFNGVLPQNGDIVTGLLPG